jgi:hypothetical protein
LNQWRLYQVIDPTRIQNPQRRTSYSSANAEVAQEAVDQEEGAQEVVDHAVVHVAAVVPIVDAPVSVLTAVAAKERDKTQAAIGKPHALALVISAKPAVATTGILANTIAATALTLVSRDETTAPIFAKAAATIAPITAAIR